MSTVIVRELPYVSQHLSPSVLLVPSFQVYPAQTVPVQHLSCWSKVLVPPLSHILLIIQL